MPHRLPSSDLPDVPAVDPATGRLPTSSTTTAALPRLRDEDVRELEEWARGQKLPITPDLYFGLFLIASDYDVDKAKERLKSFFAVRKKSTDFFSDWDLNREKLRNFLTCFHFGIVPQRTPDNCRVVVVVSQTTDGGKFDFVEFARMVCMILETFFLTEPDLNGVIFVYDLKKISISHFMRIGFTAPKKFNQYLQEAMPSKLVCSHLVNCSGIIDKGLKIVKGIITRADWTRVATHLEHQTAELHKMLPLSCLPSDYGGTSASVQELHDFTMQRLEEFSDLLRRQEAS